MGRENKKKTNTWTGTLGGNENRKESRTKEEKKTRAHTLWTLLSEHVSLN